MITVIAVASIFTPVVGSSSAEATDITGIYDCNTGTKPDSAPARSYEVFFDGETLTVRSGSSCQGNVIIPNGVLTIDQMAFKNAAISSIDLPSSLKIIENKAFRNSNLIQITIPNNVESIGDEAFYSNDLLETVNLGSNLRSIGVYAFEQTKISTIVIPNSVEVIGSRAFSYNSELTTVRLGENLKTIGSMSFANTALTSLKISDSVESIENGAFSNNLNLNLLNLGSGIKNIATYAFDNTRLSKVVIPQSVEYIGPYSFGHIPFLDILSLTDSITSVADAPDLYAAFENSSLSSTSIQYCGNRFLVSGKFNDISPICIAPSGISVSASTDGNQIFVSFSKAVDHGGAPITNFQIENEEGQTIQTLNYFDSSSFALSNQPKDKSLKYRLKVESSAGLIGYSGFTNQVVLRSDHQPNVEEMRLAEIKRQEEIVKSREENLKKLKQGLPLSLEDLNKSEFYGVTQENLGRVQNRIQTMVEKNAPQIQDIEKAIRFVRTIDSIKLQGDSNLNVRGQDLVDVGLISEQSKNKTLIWYLIKNAPVEFRKDEESIISFIAQIQAQIEERRGRIDLLKARAAARKVTP